MVWNVVDRIVDRAPRLDAVRAHRIQLLAARRLRALGKEVPPELAAEERAAAVAALVAPEILTAVRDVAAGPIVLFKGPEVAALYPDPGARAFTDLDVLVEDAAALHQALQAAGFEEVGDPRLYEGIHHLRPLVLPRLALPVEIHARPKWISWHRGPGAAELIERAIPSASGVDGVTAPTPEDHALILAAHSWAHEPLRRVADLVDIAAVAERADPRVVAERAEEWGLTHVWRTTRRAVDALFGGGRRPVLAGIWARNVFEVRERTVLETHLESWLSPFAARPPLRALAGAAQAIAFDVRRDRAEPWGRKLRRSSYAVARAGRPRSEHDRLLERVGADAGGPLPRDVDD